jgi:hypothetical protein
MGGNFALPDHQAVVAKRLQWAVVGSPMSRSKKDWQAPRHGVIVAIGKSILMMQTHAQIGVENRNLGP